MLVSVWQTMRQMTDSADPELERASSSYLIYCNSSLSHRPVNFSIISQGV